MTSGYVPGDEEEENYLPIAPEEESLLFQAGDPCYAALDVPGFRGGGWLYLGQSYLIPVVELRRWLKWPPSRLSFEVWARLFRLAQQKGMAWED